MPHRNPLAWLSQSVFPLWLDKGVDRVNGGFIENLSLEAQLLPGPRRSMVQARQIYALRTALSLGVCDQAKAETALRSGLDFFVKHYSLSSGAFRHSIDEKGAPLNEMADLYGQAFALFALAEAHAFQGGAALRDRARSLLEYLRRERKAPGGGFTEIADGNVAYRSNPHMHLFEAAVAWMETDSDPAWKKFADEILTLCLDKFIDPATGAICENFSSGWARELQDGRYFFEPGHLFEWSWLMGRYQKLTGTDLLPVRLQLFELGEKHGISPTQKAAYDQIWSDLQPKLKSSRFWPQCERIKAASQLGRKKEANEGMAVLFRYFELPIQGLWFDTMEESGQFRHQPVKASSLYHIIGAISEHHKAEG